MAIGYNWVNIAGYAVQKGSATVTFYIDVKLNRQDVANNYSVVDTRLTSTISGGLAGSGYQFTLTGSGGISGSGVWTFSNTTILTGQTVIYHNADGTKSSSASSYCYNKYWGISISFAGGFDLPTIPRASQPSCITFPNTTTDIGNIGDTVAIHMNRKSSSFTHTVRCAFGNYTATIATGVGDNYIWTIPNDFYNQIPNDNQGNGTIYADTYNGSTFIGTKSVGFICHVTNSNPTFNNILFSEERTKSLTGSINNNIKIIYGLSKVKITISTANKATAINGASMVKYQALMGTVSANADYSSSSNVVMELDNVDGNTLQVSAVDSRGNSTTIIKDTTTGITVVPYSPITSTIFTMTRYNNISEVTELDFTGTVDVSNLGATNNSLQSVKLYYKQKGASTWETPIVISTSGIVDAQGNISINQLIIGDTATGFDLNNSYDIEIELIDKVLNVCELTKTIDIILGSGSPAKAVQGNCIALGLPYDDDCGGRIQLNKDIYVYDGDDWIPLFVDD